MKYKNIIYMCLVIIIATFVIYKFVGNIPRSNKTAIPAQSQSTLTTQTNSEGAVTVEVTPKNLISDSQAIFEIVFDTHSVELNYDVAKIAQLTDDTSNTYKPISWTGGKGSHHIEGVLTFPVISKSVKKITLAIPNIDNQDRIFSWDLK